MPYKPKSSRPPALGTNLSFDWLKSLIFRNKIKWCLELRIENTSIDERWQNLVERRWKVDNGAKLSEIKKLIEQYENDGYFQSWCQYIRGKKKNSS